MAETDWFAANAPTAAPAASQGGDWFAQNAPKQQYDYSRLTANPNGEGTYKMNVPGGQTIDVPYSKVDVVRGLSNVSFASPSESTRFQKDAEADPHSMESSTLRKWWEATTNPVGSGAKQQGFVSGAQQVGGQAVKTMAQPFVHPVDTVSGALKSAAYLAGQGMGVQMPEEWNPVAPVVAGAMRDYQQGGVPLAAENLAGQAIGTVEGGRAMAPVIEAGVDAGAAVPGAVRRAVTGDVNAPIPGTDVTPAARYQSMTSMGLQPNAAEATNSTPLSIAEKVNQNSLTAAPTYTRARAANLAALNRFTDRLLDGMSPQGPEEGGAAVQQGLRDAQVKLQNDATQGFNELDKQAGRRLLPGQTIQQAAKSIYDSYADYADQHPSLVPSNAWKLVKDLAGADNNFQPRPMRFSEVQQLRSDLLEMVRSNPDIVKNQAGGWLQQLANAADQTMTTGAAGLNPEGLKMFRDANQAWADMKATYDNPQSQLYHAVRSQSPSQLLGGIARTPEMAKTLQEALGQEGIGPIQRGVAEKLLGTTKDGGYNFKNFQGMWNKLPQAYREALFTPEQIQQLEDIGNAGTVLHEDMNPSGSARLGQGLSEMGAAAGSAAHPAVIPAVAGYHAVQYALGKLMNSPTFVDWLMRDTGAGTGWNGAPAAPGSFAEAAAMANGAGASNRIPEAVRTGQVPSGWDFANNRPKQ